MDQPKRTGKARLSAMASYAAIADKCWLCLLDVSKALEIAHLDQNRGNDLPDNLAFLCPSCHRLHDLGVITSEEIKLCRDALLDGHSELSLTIREKALEEHRTGLRAVTWKKLQKGAQERAGITIRRSYAAKRAAKTRALKRQAENVSG